MKRFEEIVGALFKIGELPFKVILAVAIFSAVPLWLPARWLVALHLDQAMTTYGWIDGLIFVGSVTLVAINIIFFIGGVLFGWVVKRQRFSKAIQALPAMPMDEKCVLREYVLRNADVLHLPIGHPTVVSLIRKGMLREVGRYGQQSSLGVIWSVELVPAVRDRLTLGILELPTPEDFNNPASGARERVMQERPDFLNELDRWRGLWGY